MCDLNHVSQWLALDLEKIALLQGIAAKTPRFCVAALGKDSGHCLWPAP